MSTIEHRQRFTGTAGNTVTSSTLSSGGSSFTDVSSLTNATVTYIANPDTTSGLEATVMQIDMGSVANYVRLVDTVSSGATNQISASCMFRIVSARNAATMQVMAILAQPSGGSSHNGLALNFNNAGGVQLATYNDAGTATYNNLSGVTLALDTWYRINIWADCSGGAGKGVAGIAIYNVAGSSVGSATYSTLDLGASTTTFMAMYLGKLDKSAQNTKLLLSDEAYSFGQASDFGVSPSMTAPTPPTLSGFTNMSADAGQRVQVFCITKPTTSGATEVGITVTTTSAVDAVTGSAVALNSSNNIAWGNPATTSYTVNGITVSVPTARTQEATMPYLQRPLTYTCTITGTDSAHQSASQTFTLTVYSHDIWHNGPNGLVPGVVSIH